eukprot:s4544_g6.t1
MPELWNSSLRSWRSSFGCNACQSVLGEKVPSCGPPSDSTFILEAAAQNLRVLQVCDAEHREDRELIRAAIKQTLCSFSADFLPYLRSQTHGTGEDESMPPECLRNWNALRYAAPFLRRDPGVCLEAVQQHWRALLHCDEEMWSDRDFMHQAIRCRWQSFQFLGPDLREDHELVLEAVSQDAAALDFVGEKLRTDALTPQHSKVQD